METTKKLVLLLFKDYTRLHTVTSISKELKISRVGAWKILKRLESEELITLKYLGEGKTSATIANVNFDNDIIDKFLAFALTEEALHYKRWRVNFNEIEKYVSFLILYGSILTSPNQANDVDLIGIISNKQNFTKIQSAIDKVQKTQTKAIHTLNFTKEEFTKELKKLNKAFLDAVKKGTILYGQEEFIKFIKRLHVVKT